MMDQAPSSFIQSKGSDSPKPTRPRGRGKAQDTKKLTQCEIVRSALEKEIFAGLLAPATPLDEDAIARRFSVSRTPVREAMLQLIEAGLVEKPSRQRAVVASLDIRRLIQMFDTLSELEAVCARLAARRITPQEIDTLKSIQAASQAALHAEDENEFGHQGIRFHVTLWRATHNDVLFEITRNLAIRLNPYRMFQLRASGRQEANHEDHKELLSLVSNGKADEAYALMRSHVTVQGDVLAEYISCSPRPLLQSEYT